MYMYYYVIIIVNTDIHCKPGHSLLVLCSEGKKCDFSLSPSSPSLPPSLPPSFPPSLPSSLPPSLPPSPPSLPPFLPTQGTTKAQCTVYLWDYHDKMVISDIDGTITRSDVAGHVLPLVGMDWTQNGVVCGLRQ